jgi:hypothetical protein
VNSGRVHVSYWPVEVPGFHRVVFMFNYFKGSRGFDTNVPLATQKSVQDTQEFRAAEEAIIDEFL